jgi:hypothetical protein
MTDVDRDVTIHTEEFVMKKSALLSFLGVSLVALTAQAAVTVRYHNGDSQKHTFQAVCSGSNYTVTFDASTTGSTTIQGSAPCVVKSQGGDVTLKGGENVEIKNGKIQVK